MIITTFMAEMNSLRGLDERKVQITRWRRLRGWTGETGGRGGWCQTDRVIEGQA